MQNRTHTCNELRISDVGKKVQLSGWMENIREVGGNLAFIVLRDFYGSTQLVAETEDILRLKEALILSERQSMMNGNLTMKMNNNFGNSLFNDYDSVGENSINLTEYGYGGFGNGMNNNYNSFFKNKNNAMNSNNNLLMSPNMSDINLKDVNNLKDDEDKK